MLRTPNPEVLAALRRLSALDNDFKVVLAWLQAERQDLSKTLSVQRDSWTVAQHQGAVQLLDKLSELVAQSRR
jgi:hypothetical protein